MLRQNIRVLCHLADILSSSGMTCIYIITEYACIKVNGNRTHRALLYRTLIDPVLSIHADVHRILSCLLPCHSLKINVHIRLIFNKNVLLM